MAELVSVKEDRNLAIRESEIIVDANGNQRPRQYTDVYEKVIGKATYRVKGTPSISTVDALLVGLKNPEQNRLQPTSDDGQPKSVEVWINEFSLNEFKKEGGVAATGRMQATLGDLGSVSVAGSFTQANFGQIEQKLTDLSQDNVG